MLTLLAHVEAAGGLRETWEIFTNVPHILAEVGWEIVTFVVMALIARPLIRKAVARHDREVHGHDAEVAEDDDWVAMDLREVYHAQTRIQMLEDLVAFHFYNTGGWDLPPDLAEAQDEAIESFNDRDDTFNPEAYFGV